MSTLAQMRIAGHLIHAWLTLDFFGDTADRDASGSTLTTTIFGQSFLAFCFAALLYPDYPVATFAAANLSLSTLLIALGVLATPGRAQRERADTLLLHTAPLPAATVALARLGHGSFYVALTTIGMALPPAILCYWLPTAGEPAGLFAVVRYLGVAVLLAGLATGALGLLRALTVRILGDIRGELLMGSLRAALLFGGFVGFAVLLPDLDEPAKLTAMAPWLSWLPPTAGARFVAESWAGASGIAAWSLVLLSLFAPSAWIQRDRRRRAARRSAPRLFGLDALVDALTPPGPRRGYARFVAIQLYRSAGFRAKVLPLFALPFAMVVLALSDSDTTDPRLLLGITLQLPAIYLPILVAFLAEAEHERSGWIFATTPEPDRLAAARAGSQVALVTHVLLPTHALAAITMLACGIDAATALGNSCFALGASIPIAQFALRRLQCVPFTDERQGVSVDFGDLMAAGLVLGLVGGGFALVATGWAAVGGGLAVLLLNGWLLHRHVTESRTDRQPG